MIAGSIHRAQLLQAAELLDEILACRGPADRLTERYFRARRRMGGRDRAFVAETVFGVLHRRRQLDTVIAAACMAPQFVPQSVATDGGGILGPRPPTPSPYGEEKRGRSSGAGEAADSPPPFAERGREGEVAAWRLSPGLAYALAHVVAFGGWTTEALAQRGFAEAGAALAAHLGAARDPALPFAVRANLPDWLAGRLLAELGEAEAWALAKALHQPAPLDLRVNPLRATRETAAEALAEAGFAVELARYSPAGLRCQGRKPLQSTRPFREGWIEVQDEGSQLVSLLLEPRRGQRLADFCAGAGGKSLHLAVLLENAGSVEAFDVSARRLAALRQRLRRARLDNIRARRISGEEDLLLGRFAGKMAAVLVDAPCSGTGTIRRNPDILWRPIDLDELAATQRRILAAAARLVQPGGRLVYVTCSLVRQENEEVVESFLAEHREFRVLPAGEILRRQGVAIEGAETAEGHFRLLPHRHHTDGFRAAVLERSGARGGPGGARPDG
jgi:16S rRNA (cytosine967-C5)-methyltransferase